MQNNQGRSFVFGKAAAVRQRPSRMLRKMVGTKIFLIRFIQYRPDVEQSENCNCLI